LHDVEEDVKFAASDLLKSSTCGCTDDGTARRRSIGIRVKACSEDVLEERKKMLSIFEASENKRDATKIS
jgi:hypothetical protein